MGNGRVGGVRKSPMLRTADAPPAHSTCTLSPVRPRVRWDQGVPIRVDAFVLQADGLWPISAEHGGRRDTGVLAVPSSILLAAGGEGTGATHPGCPLLLGLVTGTGALRPVSVVGVVALPLTSLCFGCIGDFAPSAEQSNTGVCQCADVPSGKYTDVNVRDNINVYNYFPQLRDVLEQKISILGVGTSIL